MEVDNESYGEDPYARVDPEMAAYVKDRSLPENAKFESDEAEGEALEKILTEMFEQIDEVGEEDFRKMRARVDSSGELKNVALAHGGGVEFAHALRSAAELYCCRQQVRQTQALKITQAK